MADTKNTALLCLSALRVAPSELGAKIRGSVDLAVPFDRVASGQNERC